MLSMKAAHQDIVLSPENLAKVPVEQQLFCVTRFVSMVMDDIYNCDTKKRHRNIYRCELRNH